MKQRTFHLPLMLIALSLLTSCRQYTTTYFENRLGDLRRKAFGIPWNPFIRYGALTDARDGHTYRTVKIGHQTWMAENLNYKIANSSCGGNSEDSCIKYGRFYEWEVAMNIAHVIPKVPLHLIDSPFPPRYRWGGPDSLHQGICPEGWHLPTYTEWEQLITCIKKDSTALRKDSLATIQLTSLRGWPIEIFRRKILNDFNGTDTYGFRALPAGEMSYGTIPGNGGSAGFWSATEVNGGFGEYAWIYFIGLYRYVNHMDAYKSSGHSVRCVEDPM